MGQPCTPELKGHTKGWGMGRWRPLLPPAFQINSRVVPWTSHNKDNILVIFLKSYMGFPTENLHSEANNDPGNNNGNNRNILMEVLNLLRL